MPSVISRGRALSRTEIYSFIDSIGFITYNDCLDLAVRLYGMDEGTFKVLLGWDRNENYEYNTNTYDGYMCTCAGVNRFAGYGYTTPQGLCDSLRGGGSPATYNVPRLQGLADQVRNNESTQQLNLKCTYLALANPDQRVWGFAGDGGNPFPSELIIYVTQDLYGTPVYCTLNPNGTSTYGYDVDGGVLGQGYDVYSDTGVPTKLSEFRAKIFHALACPTGYWSGMGIENFGYWNGSLFFFDCVNLIKAILGGWFDRRVVGLCSPNLISQILSQTGDCNEWGLITQCAGMSSDFTQLTQTSVLYMDGHIGCFVGDYVRDGKTYNVIECTSGYLGTGVISSYVTSTGMRTSDKNSNVSHGYWTYHGLLTPWLIYDVGNIDPGGNISPVNPGGGEVYPDPEYTNPYFPTFGNKQWMYQKRYDLQPKNRWRYI